MSDNTEFTRQRRAQTGTDAAPGLDTPGEHTSTRATPASSRFPFWPVVAVVICLIAPIVLICLVALERHGFVSRVHYELRARHETLAIVQRIDEEFARLGAIGQTLATSPYLSTADLAAFRQQAQQIGTLDKIGITLSDASGQLLIDTRATGETHMPFDSAAIVLELQKAKRPLVIAPTEANGQSARAFAAVTPVFAPGTHNLTHLLVLHVPVSRLKPLVDATDTIGMKAYLLDDRGQIIVHASAREDLAIRSDQIKNVEQTVGEWSLWPTKDAEGEPLFVSFGRSRLTGWLVRVDFLGSVLQRTHNRFRRDLVVFAALLLLVSLSVYILALRRFWRWTIDHGKA